MMPMLPDTPTLADSTVWRRVEDDLARFSFGGYIVFRGDGEQTPPYLSELQEIAEFPLLIGCDLERGAGQHLKGLTDFPPPMALGAARNPDLAYQQGAITALEARQAGIHWIFAPTLDLASRPDNPIINVRGFGDEPRQVGVLGAAFVTGVQRHHAFACAKHFPGHGETAEDSHSTLPTLHVSRHRLEVQDLAPFRQAIQGGVKSIMVGHLAVPALDESGLPATMSRRVVTDLLREQMGFKGLVITDALNMGAIAERFDPGYAAVRCLQAGCDVLLMPPDPEAVVEAVLRAIEEGGLTKARLLESVERLFDAKAELGLWRSAWDDEPELPAQLPDYAPAVYEITDAAVTLVQNEGGVLPLGPERKLASVVLDDDDDAEAQAAWRAALAPHGEIPTTVLTGSSDPEAIAAAVAACAGADTVIVPAFMAVRAWKNRVALPETLAGVPAALRAAGHRVVVASFTSPYLLTQFPEIEGYVCAYTPLAAAQQSTVRALWGQLPFQGRLPVDFPLALH